MIDIAGTTLTPEDTELLLHPNTSGVILFTRNYESPEQLINLTNAIHALKNPPLMIAVDHEGGRVQRFKDGFTPLPAMRDIADNAMAEKIGFIMGSELRAAGINCSFAPVLDIDAGISDVIGNRSFSADPRIIIEKSLKLMAGMHKAGIIAVGKHFPGHGHVAADSHTDIPIDTRSLEQIKQCDLIPFEALIKAGIDGIMPAHVIYDEIDPNPAGFSTFWLHTILRQQLGFKGIIFSDDLCMIGASPMGKSITERAIKAKQAGCDMLLVCNNRPAAREAIYHEYT